MIEVPRPQRLLEWALAAFHNGFFSAAIIALLYGSGNLAELLGSLNTLIGIAIFAFLWGLTWLTTRRALAGVDWLARERPGQFLPIPGRGLIWGGVNALLFFVAMLLVFSLMAIVPFGLQPQNSGLSLSAIPGLLLIGAVGSVVALVVGATVGLLLGLLDMLIVLLAWTLTKRVVNN
jgi:hypothetical protein